MKRDRKGHNGDFAGRDPRKMTRDELREAGHEPMSPLRALRARCLDCCAGQANEVAACPVVECPSWPFRMGTNPWRKPASEARRVSARRTMERINARRKRDGDETAARPPEHGATPLPGTGSGAALSGLTSRVDRDPETERHRVDGTASGQVGNQLRDGPAPGDGLSEPPQGGLADAPAGGPHTTDGFPDKARVHDQPEQERVQGRLPVARSGADCG
jgi:hypothetical protein